MQKEQTVVNAYLVGGRDSPAFIKILRRDEQSNLVETKIKASYDAFVRAKDSRYLEPLRKKGRTVKSEGPFTRICFNSYEERDRFCRGDENREAYFKKHNVEVFEADLNPIKRWLIDSDAKIQKPIWACLDLETDSRVPFARKGEARILCWGLVIKRKDGSTERVGGILEEDTDEAEVELIKDLFYELAFVDLILAWNGDNFDFEVLKERIKRLRVGIDFRRWLKCDHMLLFQKYNMTASDSGDQKASMALNRVAESLGVEGKLKDKGTGSLEGVEVGGALSWQFWAAGGRNRELLGEYCVEDAAVMERIESLKGFVDILCTLAQTCRVFPDSRGMMGKNFVETFVMSLGAKLGMRAPTKYGGETVVTEQFDGAFVFETQKGLFRDVHMCDFSRLYPSIMQAWNMSPETHLPPLTEEPPSDGRLPEKLSLEDACAKSDRGVAVCPLTLERFRIDGPRGLFAKALDEIVEQRKYWSNKKYEYKPGSKEFKECKDRDSAYKIIANTFYGVSGSPFSRFFMRELSESVTQIGVWLIQATAKEGEKRGLKLILGDTDSCAMTGCTTEEFEEFIKYCNEVLYPSMIKPCQADSKFISLAFEKTLSLLINVVAKTYAGRQATDKGVVCADDIAPTVKGLEYKRGDTVRLAREFQEEIVKTILLYGKPVPNDYPLDHRDLVPIVEKWQKKILGADFEFKDAVFAKRMTKEINEYNATGPNGQPLPPPSHIRIAQQLIQKGFPIYPGVKIEYVVTDGRTSPQTIKYAGESTKEDVDLYHLWETGVWPAAERVLTTVWPEYLWERWGAVRPLKGVLDGQVGFGFGERGAQI